MNTSAFCDTIASMENVVVFTGGEAPLFLQTLTHWTKSLPHFANPIPDYVIAADSGLDTLRLFQNEAKKASCGLDFSPRLILGDFDSLSEEKILLEYDRSIIERSSPYKDLTDTEMALSRARKLFPHAFITLVGGGGGRADHFLGIYDLFGSSISPDAWLLNGQSLFYAKKRSFYVRGLGKDSPVSVSRAPGKNFGGKIVTRGLEWESPVFRKRGMPSISNRISEEFFNKNLPVEFHFKSGSFVLILPEGAQVSLGQD